MCLNDNLAGENWDLKMWNWHMGTQYWGEYYYIWFTYYFGVLGQEAWSKVPVSRLATMRSVEAAARTAIL